MTFDNKGLRAMNIFLFLLIKKLEINFIRNLTIFRYKTIIVLLWGFRCSHFLRFDIFFTIFLDPPSSCILYPYLSFFVFVIHLSNFCAFVLLELLPNNTIQSLSLSYRHFSKQAKLIPSIIVTSMRSK